MQHVLEHADTIAKSAFACYMNALTELVRADQPAVQWDKSVVWKSEIEKLCLVGNDKADQS